MVKDKAAKSEADKPKKKKKKAVNEGVSVKVRLKDGGKKKSKKSAEGLETLAKLADHPMVADLLAIGATAAVAALAERGLNKKGEKSSTGAVKAAGKAAAAAIGKRLVSEFNAVKDSATEAAKKA